VAENDMPENCIVCRVIVDGEGALGKELRERNERRVLEESVLEGLRGLDSVFGGVMCRRTVDSVDERIEEVRRQWRGDMEALFLKFESVENERSAW
jgi:hypothetical protein